MSGMINDYLPQLVMKGVKMKWATSLAFGRLDT